MSRPWPFGTWMKLAVTRYGLSPNQFWQMSVHDWRALTKADGPDPLRRNEFDALTQHYPDSGKDTE